MFGQLVAGKRPVRESEGGKPTTCVNWEIGQCNNWWANEPGRSEDQTGIDMIYTSAAGNDSVLTNSDSLIKKIHQLLNVRKD